MKTFIYWLVLQALSFAPTIVACHRNHPNSAALTALNYLGGWTIIGWIGAFVWALADGLGHRTLTAETLVRVQLGAPASKDYR